MSNTNNQVIGVRKLIPIIDFNCIVDTEYGLLQLIYDQYYDLSVFNKDKFEMPTNKILLELYTRTTKNPLVPFVNDNISEKDANEYYNEFMDTKYEEILSRSVGTNMQVALTNFNLSGGEVLASIMCHNDLQKEYISGIQDFSSNKVYTEEEFIKRHSDFNQIYLRYIDDMEGIVEQCMNKSVYLSSCSLNMKEKDSIYLREDEKLNLVSKYAYIMIYDLFNIDYLKGE